ncbi:MAG: NAD-dependent epimerase/dehydratase family protein [Patescibacteria group bacterium]|nr:NAD-dependent epimerase/dehydratase family protein [Patescibacteria group bacterium]
MKIIITGGAGFIGSHLVKKLAERGGKIVIVDNFNDYYNPQLKRDRISIFLKDCSVKLYEQDICDFEAMEKIFQQEKADKIIHLAAMAGVRNSFKNPFLYEKVNIQGTLNLLELSVKYKIKKFVLASSSSVYGANKKFPFSEDDKTDTPLSPYASTKKATELMAHVYHSAFGLKIAILRYFTVYGPWGRPDMSYFKFTKHIFADQPIEVYNSGEMWRSFTYIDDAVSGTIKALDANSEYAILNVGNDTKEKLTDFIDILEQQIGKKAKRKLQVIQKGDVLKTEADISKLKAMDWQPVVGTKEGLQKFAEWYREYYKIQK